MPEAVALSLAGSRIDLDEALALERLEVNPELLAQRLGDELHERVHRKHLAGHGRRLDDGPLVEGEPVESGGHERLDRRRRRQGGDVGGGTPDAVLEAQEPFLHRHREELLQEERVAVGSLDDPAARLLVDPGLPEDGVDDRVRIGLAQALQGEAACRRLGRERRSLLEQVVPGVRDHQEGDALHGLEEVLDEVEERLLRPVQVVEDHDQRPLPRQRLDELADAPEELLDRELLHGEPDGRGDALGCSRIVDEGVELRARARAVVAVEDAGGLAHGLDERPERDALTVWEAAPP